MVKKGGSHMRKMNPTQFFKDEKSFTSCCFVNSTEIISVHTNLRTLNLQWGHSKDAIKAFSSKPLTLSSIKIEAPPSINRGKIKTLNYSQHGQ